MSDPIKTSDFGLAVHTMQSFTATVPGSLKPEDLENPALWVHVAPQLQIGSEVRVLADDQSFVAYLICTFRAGSLARMKTMHGYELEQVDYDALDNQTGDLIIKQRGVKKWCIIQQSTGEVIKEGIANQSKAMRELEDYQRALAS